MRLFYEQVTVFKIVIGLLVLQTNRITRYCLEYSSYGTKFAFQFVAILLQMFPFMRPHCNMYGSYYTHVRDPNQ